MDRKFVMALAVVFICGLGCGRKEPAAAPSDALASVPQVEIPASPQVKAEVPQAVPAPPVTKAAPAVASPHRDLVSRYLESDGKGGWRKNEQPATDLEKLSDEETAQLWPLLMDPDANVRRGTAVFLLGVFNPATHGEVEAFAALLGDSDAMVRARGLDAVKQFAPADQIAALARLSALLDSKREERIENRMTVARMCGALKRDAAPALPALKQTAIGDPDVKVRAAALGALAQVAEPIEAANTLAAGLGDKEVAVRVVASARLRQLGPAAAVVAQPLAVALGDSSQEVTEAAAEALIRIGAPSASPLGEQLGSTNVTTRKLALACLIKLGPLAKPAAGRIEKCKSDTDPEVRKLAEVALSRILAK